MLGGTRHQAPWGGGTRFWLSGKEERSGLLSGWKKHPDNQLTSAAASFHVLFVAYMAMRTMP
jgi:hypothetical protein